MTPGERPARTAAALALLAFAAVALYALILPGCGREEQGRPAVPADRGSGATASTSAPPAAFNQQTFVNRRTINYVASEPANNSLSPVPVEEVILYFSKPLGAGSFIDVMKDGLKVNAGQVMVAPDNRSMHVPVAAGVTGNYTVRYAAYFYSGYYEEGSFGFSVYIR